MFEDILSSNRILSLDIETTGLTPGKHRMWSIGVHDDKGSSYERFIDFTNGKGEVEARRALLDSGGEFAKTQLSSGSFDDLFSAMSSGASKTEAASISEMMSVINKDSVILIQNANFENRFIGQAVEATGIPVTDNMRFRSVSKDGAGVHPVTGDKLSGRFLYTPPEVTNLRRKAGQAVDDLRRGHGTAKEVSNIYDAMMESYSDSIKSKKGAVVVDLMDVTKATYAKAASINMIDGRHNSIGTSVEFLTRMLYGEEEKHTAISDAIHQRRIFGSMTSMYNEIVLGTPSSETTQAFDRIRSAIPHEIDRQIHRSILNTLEEIDQNGQTLINVTSFKPTGGIDVIDSEGARTRVSIARAGLESTDIPKIAVANVMERFKYAIGEESAERIHKEFSDMGDIGEMMKIAKEKADAAKQNIVNVSTGAKAASTTVTSAVVSNVQTNVPQTSGAAPKVSNLSIFGAHKKTAITVAAMLGGLTFLEYGTTSPSAVQQRKGNPTLDDSFLLYDKTYHGSGFADWNERIGHGEF
jgi:hypothetical protein